MVVRDDFVALGSHDGCCRAEPAGEHADPATDLMAFAQPLLDNAYDDETTDQAMNLGMIFWNMAIETGKGGSAERLRDEIETSMRFDEESRCMFWELAARMIARHKEMFPHLHGQGR